MDDSFVRVVIHTPRDFYEDPAEDECFFEGAPPKVEGSHRRRINYKYEMNRADYCLDCFKTHAWTNVVQVIETGRAVRPPK